MTMDNGRFDPESKQEILNALVASAETVFEKDFSDEQAIVLASFYDPVAEYLASQQEDISTVLDNAQIDHATGEALDLLGALIGVTRIEARSAETREKFKRDDPATKDYPVQKGTTVATEGTDSVVFETDEFTAIKYIDGFEDGDIAEYSDSTTFSTQQSTVYNGSWALQADNSSIDNIINADDTVEIGSRVHYRTYLEANTISGFLLAAQDDNNHYRVVVDASAGDVYVESVDGGSASVVGAKKSAAVPTGEWLHVDVSWEHGGVFDITVNNASGSEVISFTVEESGAPTFETGGVGFRSADTNGSKYWDHVQMQATSVDVTATEPGAEGNVASDTLVVERTDVNGVHDVTNPISASLGRDEEKDEEYRERAKSELSEGGRATQRALIDRLSRLEETRSVTVIVNDDNTADAEGRPPHSFEVIVDTDTPFYDVVAQRILDTKAAGDIPVGGYAGSAVTETADLPNDQEKDITFSVPSVVDIYVNCSLTKNEDYEGNSVVQDSIVQYIGGTLNSGNNVDGELDVGEDVIYNQVLNAVMSINGVVDVTNLDVDTASPPSGTSNISISDTSIANADATDGSIDITTSDV